MDASRVLRLGERNRVAVWLPGRHQRHRPGGRNAGQPDADGGIHPMKTADTNIEIPDFALVVLIGPTGSGKSTFAAKHFAPTEVISSDYCRALVSDSEIEQGVSADAFDLVREIAGKRLK